jgi:hypothetical protein
VASEDPVILDRDGVLIDSEIIAAAMLVAERGRIDGLRGWKKCCTLRPM